MYTLTKRFTFEAAHMLEHHDGKCRRLHGHSWKAEVELRGDVLWGDGAKRGMLIDYGDVSRAVKPLIEDYLDHHHLNDTLGTDSPTSEFVAEWIFNALKGQLDGLLWAVIIEETCTSRCRFAPYENV